MDRGCDPGVHVAFVEELTFERATAVCRSYEEANGVGSAEFYERYKTGEFVGTSRGQHAMRWATYFEAYLELRPEPDVEELRPVIPDHSGDLVLTPT